MKEFAIVKKTNTIRANNTEIQTVDFSVETGNCYYGSLAIKGKKAKVVAGRKLPKGSIVTIEHSVANKYAARQTCLFSDELANPAVLVITEEGKKVWIQGKNLDILPEELDGFVEKIEAKDEEAARKICLEKYESQIKTGTVWFVQEGKPVSLSNVISDYGMEIYSQGSTKYFKETKNTYAMVIDDWRTDTYYFVAFTKEPKLSNLVAYVSKGTSKRCDDMGGETGLKEAIDAFEKYQEV